MHLNLDIPAPLYAEIAQEAAAHGRSVEAVALDRLSVHSTDEAPASFWTPERLASIDAAFEEGDRLGGISMDEAHERIAARSRAWRSNSPV